MEECSEKPKKRRKDGGTRCAAWGCDKSKLKDRIGVFQFPSREKSPQRHDFWCKTVRRTRQDFRFVEGTSRLCADHFDRDQIQNWMQIEVIQKEKGRDEAAKIKWRLVPKARPNPDLFPKRPAHGTPVVAASVTTPRQQPPARGASRPWAAKKDRRMRVKAAMESTSSNIPEPPETPSGLPSISLDGPSWEGETVEHEFNDAKPHFVVKYGQIKRPPHLSLRCQIVPNTFSVSQGTPTDDLEPPCSCACNCSQETNCRHLPNPPVMPDMCTSPDDSMDTCTVDELLPSQPHDSDPDYELDSADASVEDCYDRELADMHKEVNLIQPKYESETPPSTDPCSPDGSLPRTPSPADEIQSNAEEMANIQGGISDSLTQLVENQKMVVAALSELVKDQKQLVASQEEMVAVVREGVNAIRGALELYRKKVVVG